MVVLRTSFRPSSGFDVLRFIAKTSPSALTRALSTLPQNPHIYVHEQPDARPKQYLLSLLAQTPPIASLAIGTSPQEQPSPETLTENPEFMKIVQWVIRDNAMNDPDVQAQAAMYASQAGSALGSGGVFFPQQQQAARRRGSRDTRRFGGGGGVGGDGAGGASAQGGMGGAGRGGYIHVSDQRNPPDFGRVAWPEDIFGSLELDGKGNFVDGNGRYQEAGTYRIMTNEGILGLSPFLRKKLVDKLQELDGQARRHS